MIIKSKKELIFLALILISTFLCIGCYSKGETKVIYHKGFIDKKYFEKDELESKISNMEGGIDIELTYPHAYRYLLEKDIGVYPFRKGYYFIDESTKSVNIDTLFNACTDIVYSDLNEEYRNKFIPYHYETSFDNCSIIIENVYFNRLEDDENLNNYIIENPNSYVALWHLIERVSYSGYLEIRMKALINFSDEVKQSKIWKLLEKDLLKLKKYAKGHVLPNAVLKSVEMNEEVLDFSSLANTYTLVEFWFSRCKPCHKAFEVLVPMHAKFKSEGFNIIGISTDVTQEIPLWHENLDKYEFHWSNYLDENGKVAKEMNISSFPSNFLLDEKGEIIAINISTQDLESFLEKSL